MIKRKMFAALLAATVLSLPGPVFAYHGEPMYVIRYYSDSSYSEEVGTDYPFCQYDGSVGYSHFGQTTEFIDQYVSAYCIEGNIEPIH